MQLSMDSPLPTFITIHDAIIDSPVYRSTALHFDDQLDMLEKWLDSLAKHIKSYVDKLNKFNMETNILCKKVIPVGITDTMIDPNFAGAIIKSFSDALQTNLAFKTKLVSDLEDTFIQPLQSFIKTHLKDFKEFRKQHEKMLERYESQLSKYTSQSKIKEASAVREEAFRLYEIRKSYMRMSSQHVVRMLHFRSVLEHFIVEKFSLAANCHLKDFEGGWETWTKLKSSLVAWKQWLVDDKETCQYQLHQLQSTRSTMEEEFMNSSRPARNLEKYNVGNTAQATFSNRHSLDYSSALLSSTTNQPSCKWGYLNVKSAKTHWARKWFFLNEGCFGSLDIRTSTKNKGAITIGDCCVSVLLSDIKPVSDTTDRRYCFEVLCVNQSAFTLQAESEQEMHEWLGAFEKAKQLMLQNEQLDLSNGSATYVPTLASASGMASSRKDIDENDDQRLATVKLDPPTCLLDSLLVMSVDQSGNSTLSTEEEAEKSEQSQIRSRLSTVVVSTLGIEKDLTHSKQPPSLTPLLLKEATKAALQLLAYTGSVPSSPTKQSFSQLPPSIEATLSEHHRIDTNGSDKPFQEDNANTTPCINENTSSSSWGIPWAFVPSMFSSTHSTTMDTMSNGNTSVSNSPTTSFQQEAELACLQQRLVWPKKIAQGAMSKVDLAGYSPHLDNCNRELRALFSGVDANEVVLTDFTGVLKRMPPLRQDEASVENTLLASSAPSNNSVDALEQDLSSQLALTNNQEQPTSKYGYIYTGHAFITQSTFWFYSCILMNCINTVAISLNDIKTVRLVRDPSILNNGSSSSLVLVIELVDHSTSSSHKRNQQDTQLVFATLMDDIELVAEKLKFIISNAKTSKPESLQTVYDVIQNMSTAINKNNNVTNYSVRNIIKSATDPVRSTSDITCNSTAAVLPPTSASSIVLESPKLSRSTDTKKKSVKTPRKYSAPVQPGSKSGALAAAMMAATVAGGSGLFFDASKSLQTHDPSSSKRHGEAKHSTGSSSSTNGKSSSKFQKTLFSLSTNESKSSLTSSVTKNTERKDTHGSADNPSLSNPHAPPADFRVPTSPVSCGCDNHLDKMEAELELPVSAKHLYYILFSGTNPQYMDIWKKKTAGNKSRDLTMTQWESVDGKKERTLKYVIPVNNAMVKLKEAEVVEKQVVEKEDNYLCYVILASTKTAQLPYADAFIPYVKYCITWISNDRCKLCCFAGVKFLKNILVKGMVNKTAMKGIAENLNVFASIIEKEVGKQALVKDKSYQQVQNEDAAKLGSKNGTMQQMPLSKSSNSNTSGQRVIAGLTIDEWQIELKNYGQMLRDIFQGLPSVVKLAVGSLFFLWLFISWLRSGSKKAIFSTHDQCNEPRMITRAVFLKEIDESLLNAEAQPDWNHSESFRMFTESRMLYNSNQQTTDGGVAPYRWYHPSHHQFAVDILFSRQRLAIIRYDMLVLFQLLNDLDAQLLHDEYVNWLMDRRSSCRDPNTDFIKSHCDDVRRQLKLYSTKSHQSTAHK